MKKKKEGSPVVVVVVVVAVVAVLAVLLAVDWTVHGRSAQLRRPRRRSDEED